MKNTSLCYLEKDGKYLMLHRVKKDKDENAGKWIGVGGKFEEGESPEECTAREIYEETGLTANKLVYRAVITFDMRGNQTEYMHLFTCNDFSGKLNADCDEGVLKWVDKAEVMSLSLWEGDRIFLEEMTKRNGFFSLKLSYENDRLCKSKLYRY